MRSLAWAFLERMMPRIASAAVMLIFAAVTSPSIVGAYAWMVVALTGVQAIFDAAVRQVAVGAVSHPSGLRFLARYRIVFALVGPAVLLAVLAVLSWLAEDPRERFWSLLPMVFAPVGIAVATVSLAKLQAVGRWRAIAVIQSISVTSSLALTIPIVITTQSALGPSLQAVVVELLNAALLIMVARRVVVPAARRDAASPRREFSAASWYAALGWAQSQTDRVLVGVFGGQAVLGLYSFGWSLSRNVGDALSYASVNVLRPQLLGGEGVDDERALSLLRSSVRRSCLLLSAVVVATFVGATWVLPLILDERWAPVFTAVPVMSLSSIALVTAWSLTPMLVRAKRLRAALFGKVLGVVAAIPVAIVASIDLTAAAWVALVREIIVALCLALAARRVVPWSTYAAPSVVIVVFAALLAGYQHVV